MGKDTSFKAQDIRHLHSFLIHPFIPSSFGRFVPAVKRAPFQALGMQQPQPWLSGAYILMQGTGGKKAMTCL